MKKQCVALFALALIFALLECGRTMTYATDISATHGQIVTIQSNILCSICDSNHNILYGNGFEFP